MNAQQTTFAEQSVQYLARLERRRNKPVKPTTLATFRSIVRLVVPKLGELPLVDIESENLRQLVEYLGDKKPETISLALRVAKAVVASAVDEKGRALASRQWNRDYIDAPAVVRQEKPLITAAQIETALTSPDSPFSKSPLREFFALQASSGLRKGELLALAVEDFDASAGVLHVRRTRGYHGETTPKTRSGIRSVDLHPDVVAMLRTLVAGRTTGRLFELTINQVKYAYEQAGIPSHSLRHFRYSLLQMSSIPQPIRDFWIGHSSSGMEKIYGHAAQNKELRSRLALEVGIGFRIGTRAETAA